MPTNERISRGHVTDRLRGKVAIVTGVGSGLGQSIALLFAKAGARVIGCGRNSDRLHETGKLAGEEGLELDLSVVDASDEAQVGNWIDEAAGRHGGIDILYNNAASARFAPFAEMTAEQWHETLRLELDTVFMPSRAAWRHLIARGGGSIVNIGSINGMLGMEVVENAGAAAHAAAKGGVLALTRQMATEGAPHWIRVNAICPGPILTASTREVLSASPEFRSAFEGLTLLERGGDPMDVAYMGVFLASDESAFVTGANFLVDGGLAAKMGASFLR